MPCGEPIDRAGGPDVLSEIMASGGLGFGEAARLVPADPVRGPVNPATIIRWARKGVVGPDGVTRIRLEAAKVGGRFFTSRQAIARWVSAVSGSSAAPAPALRTPAEDRRAAEAAGRVLDSLGIRG